MTNDQKRVNGLNNSMPVPAPGGATSAQSDYPGVSGVDITNGFRYIAAVENAVRDGIGLLSGEVRATVIEAYLFALRITARTIVRLRDELEEKEGRV